MNTLEGEGGEPIQSEGLLTSPDVIFSQERSLETIISTEISPTLFGDMEDMLGDLEATNKALTSETAGPGKTNKAIEEIREADDSWKAIISENREGGESESYLEAKDRMRRIVFGAGGIIERKIEREDLNRRYGAAGGSEKLEIAKQTDELNVEDVRWQQDVIIFTLAMSRNPRGREILSRFWDSFESLHHGLNPRVTSSRSELSIGQQEARNLHNAVIGAVGTMILLDRIGYDPYLPEPHQDAEGKVDLWVKPKGAPWQGGFLGLQLKTSLNGIRGLEARDIDSHFLEIAERNPEKKKDARAARKLVAFLREYGETYQAPSSGIWVDLTGTNEDEVVDSMTGVPHFNDPYLKGHLDEFRLILDAHFGTRDIKKAA
ncbi:MAG: hypothetical protein NT039_03300 [Candidatus Berkelbacteria bacterium]|nr:hypothetical protein [Candidatus Berkelbacteria bacterium]